jgi:magnesium transporter
MHIGHRKLETSSISLIRYHLDHFDEREIDNPDDCVPLSEDQITWVNVTGMHDLELIGKMGELFRIHPLIQEDIVNTEQRAKAESYDDFVFFVMKMLRVAPEGQLQSEQVSMLLGRGFVITFQESPGDVFEPVRNRIRSGKGKIRRQKADYLAYALLDALVDQYFLVMEHLGEEIELLEARVLEGPDKKVVNQIYDLKRQLLFIRRAAWPLREVVSAFEKNESALLQKSTRVFLRDVYDHVIHIMDSVELSREIVSGLLEVYLSTVSNRTNDVMKVLTIVATIFIPLTFIVGIYGMNFDVMPELHWPWGYPAVLLLMLSVASGMLLYFRRRGWL